MALIVFALIAIAAPFRLPAHPATEPSTGSGNSKHIYVGETIDQVVVALGKPNLIVDLQSRLIYVYKDRKIIFANGRVTDADEPNAESGELISTSTPIEIRDVVQRDSSLNRETWTTGTALLRALASAVGSPPSAWVNPQIDFTSSGMHIAGVSGTNRFTGLQSNQCFNAPLIVKATVNGRISHGNAFELFLVTGDLSQWIDLDGNLDPASGYQGFWENVRIDGSSRPGLRVFDAPTTNAWYDITFAVDATGNAAVTVATEAEKQLVSTRTPGIGVGPFWIILAQREGLPYSVGPNEAIWREVSVTSGKVTTALPLGPALPNARPHGAATTGIQ
jgi:hypothetical protein